jgi:cytoskeletal protein RodZ
MRTGLGVNPRTQMGPGLQSLPGRSGEPASRFGVCIVVRQEASMDVGGELRAARRARKLSIDDISRATKIAPTLLRAIEDNAFDRVPRGLFARGFLRAYAREVGLDAESLVRHYRAEWEPPVVTDATIGSETEQAPTFDPLGGSSSAQILQIGVIVVVIAIGYLASLRPAQPVAPAPAEPEASAGPAPAPAAAPVPTTGSVDAVSDGLDVAIRPLGLCWVDATVDGTHVVARLMNAGDRQTLKVREALTLRVGDPATFSFSIDGMPGRSLGPAGVARTIRIDRTNYWSFLSSPSRAGAGAPKAREVVNR